MKTIKYLFLIAFLAYGFESIAQPVPDSDYYMDSEVVFSEGEDDGYPVGEDDEFSAGEVYVFVYNNKQPFKTTELIVDIWKHNGDDYDEFVDTKNFTIERSFTATFFSIDFDEPGRYMVSVYNEDEEWINDGYLEISGGGYDDWYSDDPDEITTFYYMDSEVVFSKGEDDGYPVGEGDVFKPGEVYVFVYNDGQPFLRDEIVVNIYEEDGDEYTDLVDTKTFYIEEDFTATFFSLDFYRRGDYLVEVNTGDDIWINDGYLTIR